MWQQILILKKTFPKSYLKKWQYVYLKCLFKI